MDCKNEAERRKQKRLREAVAVDLAGLVTSRPDLKEYADFNNDFLAWAEAEMKAGKSVDAAAAIK
jgi:hypothetical protein